MVLQTSSTMHSPSEEDIAEMNQLMSDGKRNYLCNQPQVALDCFVKLCEMLSNCYGQESEKCVEAYLYYGKTLLEIARVENGVLGHAIKETPVFGTETEPEEEGVEKDGSEEKEELTDEKKEDIRNQVEHAMRGENLYNISQEEDQAGEEEASDNKIEDDSESVKKEEESVDKEEKEKGSEKDAKMEGQEEEKVEIPANDAEMKSDEVEKKTETNEEADDGIDCGSDADAEGDITEEVSNMELAWEMFELTSVICKRQLSGDQTDMKAIKSTLAEAMHGLAQISLETERYEDSATDFTECLNIYEEILEDKNDRLIAEGHYNIALALSFDKKYSEAIERFEKAVMTLKTRVANLESKVKEIEEKSGKEKVSVEVEDWKKEINELNDLIVLDMMAKLEDAQESKKLLDQSIQTVKNAASEMFSALGGVKDGFDAGFDTPLSNESSEEINDCSVNVRSLKRKNDESSETPEKKVKKSPLHEISNTTPVE